MLILFKMNKNSKLIQLTGLKTWIISKLFKINKKPWKTQFTFNDSPFIIKIQG